MAHLVFDGRNLPFLNAAPSTSHAYLRGTYRIQLLLRGPAVGAVTSPKMESMWQKAGQHENRYVLTTIFDMSDLSPGNPSVEQVG